jgi:hypothetical protein
MSGTSATLGVVLTPVKPLRLGLTWNPQIGADQLTRTTLEDARIGVATPLREQRTNQEVHFPSTVRAGAALALGTRWQVAGDYSWRDWADWDGRMYDAEAAGSETRYGGGVEYGPGGAGALRKMSFRAGVHRSEWPQRLGGNPIHETALHLGWGISMRQDLGRLDVALEYVQAGDLAKNGYEESRWNFLLSLSGQEVWRRKSPRTR